MIKNIKVEKFKSLDNLNLDLGKFNVFVGSNASGKSNIVDALSFLSDCLANGVSTAVGMRLGWRNLLKRGSRSTDNVLFNYQFNLKELCNIELKNVEYCPLEFSYDFSINSIKDQTKIKSEGLKGAFKSLKKNTQFEDYFLRKRESVERSGILTKGKVQPIKIPTQLKDDLFLRAPFFSVSADLTSQYIRGWKFYNFDVNLSRIPSREEAVSSLANDGHNLAHMLNELAKPENEKVRERIKKVMKGLVPEFEDWDTERQFDGTLGFKVVEKGVDGAFLPKMISDGTIRLLCILVALLHQKEHTSLICIDEPERCIHPQVLKTLVEIMREVSSKTQIIITTHSIEMARWLKPEELYLVDKRDNCTEVISGKDVPSIEEFLKEFRLDELWTMGYLKKGTIG
jgi:predicted ATPase